MNEQIEKFGSKDVVGVCMDGACKSSFDLITERHIYTTEDCAAYLPDGERWIRHRGTTIYR